MPKPSICKPILCAVFLLLSTSLLMGCSRNDAKLEITAQAFSRAAAECLLDVRDRKFKYEGSPNCNALGTLSMHYIEAGGLEKDVSDRIALIAEKALKTAWMARAVSASGNHPLTLW